MSLADGIPASFVIMGRIAIRSYWEQSAFVSAQQKYTF